MRIDLAQLNDNELRELHSSLTYRLKDLKPKTRQLTNKERNLYAALDTVLKLHEPIDKFIDRYGAAKYLVAAEALETILVRAIPHKQPLSLRFKVRVKILQCLADFLRAARVPISTNSMLGAFTHLEYAVDLQFPGYIRAKLLHRVVKLAA